MSTSNDDRSGFSYTWKIENYSLCSQKTGQYITSPVFTIETFMDTKWYLKLYPRGQDKPCNQYVGLYLCRCQDDFLDSEIEIQFSLHVIDGNGKTIVNDADTEAYTFKKGTRFGNQECTLIEKLVDETLSWIEDNLTVICTMTYIRTQPSCHARTKINADHCSFNLKVPFNLNESLLVFTTEHEFLFSKTSRYSIKVAVQSNDIKIEIHKLRERSVLSRCVSCRINLMNLNGEKTHSHKAVHEFEPSKVKDIWTFNFLVTKKQLQDGDFIKDDMFTLSCEFSASTKTELSIQNSAFSHHNSLLALHTDLRNMFADKKYCDINLRTDNKTMPAHKSLLAARSPVFAAMFNQDMIENQSGIVDIPDITARTLTYFLEFIYSGTVKIEDFESALKILMAADKYQVQSLKEMCCSFLSRALSVENVCEILHIADLIRHESLKQSALEYIVTHMEEVFASSKWSEWVENNSTLLNEIIAHTAGDFEITRIKRRKVIFDPSI